MSNARKIHSDVIKLSSLSTKQPSFYFTHGFFVGLGSMPDIVPPSQWYPILLGDIEFKSEQQLSLSDSLMQLYNNVMQDCMQCEVKLPTQCKLPPSNIEGAVAPDQPLAQWCLGILSSFNLIDTSALSFYQFNTLQAVEREFLAFTNYTNLRAATRTPSGHWQSVAISIRRELTWSITHLIEALRFNPEDDEEDLFDEEENFVDFDQDAYDEFEALLDMALYEDSEEAKVLLPELIDGIEKSWGSTFIAENEGNFWQDHSTRPYMLLKHRQAQVHCERGKFKEAITELQDLLRLNPNDNQAARFTLASLLVINQDWPALNELVDNYDEPSVPILASKALMLYVQDPNSPATKATKKELLAINKHLVKYLTGQKKPKGAPDFYSPGDASEVEMYLSEYGKEAWRSVPGALFWLRQK